jgi:hypothetical protein
MGYNVQKFSNTANGGETLCYGRQDKHNHDRANQFTVDITNWLQGPPAKWPAADIAAGDFKSNQNEPKNGGREFKWNDATNLWEPA